MISTVPSLSFTCRAMGQGSSRGRRVPDKGHKQEKTLLIVPLQDRAGLNPELGTQPLSTAALPVSLPCLPCNPVRSSHSPSPRMGSTPNRLQAQNSHILPPWIEGKAFCSNTSCFSIRQYQINQIWVPKWKPRRFLIYMRKEVQKYVVREDLHTAGQNEAWAEYQLQT